ncbi:MAG: YbbR-like domain-containing protein [Anaerovoracaceae bacterium]
MLNNKSFLRIISLIIAVMLWVYVMGEINPETKEKLSDIEVTFVNTEELADRGLAVVHDEDITVNAVIKGKRSAVNDTKSTGISATVDVSDCSKGKNTAKIDFNLPEGVTLESTEKETLSFKVEKSKEKEVPVKIDFVGTDEAGDSVPWAYDTSPETVKVTGAESSIKKIECVQGTITGNVVSGSAKTVEVDLIPINKGGKEIKGLVMDSAKAETTVRLMTLRDVDINITAENIGDGLEVESISGVDSIKIIGVSDIVKEINELEATVDLSGENRDCEKEIKIKLPDNVYIYNSDSKNVVKVKLKEAE